MCCNEPCLTSHWQNGKFGFLCLNCQTFTETS